MNRKFLFWSVVMACCAGSVLTSCSDDTVPENSTPDALGTGAGTYVVAATVDGVKLSPDCRVFGRRKRYSEK